MVLQWHSLGGTWTACDTPPALVHGIALIRAAAAEYLLYGQGGRLRLQVGPNQYALAENSPRISCTRGIASFGFRRRFTVESSTGGVLFSHSYWTNQGRGFLPLARGTRRGSRLARSCGRQWSDGVPPRRCAST